MLNAVRKLALFNYRIIGLPIMYLFLFGIGFYFFTWGVFSVNRSWVAPVIINQSSERVLDITEKIVLYHLLRSSQTLDYHEYGIRDQWYREQNDLINSQMQMAQDSPYYLAATGYHDFAFVPYTNESAAAIGAPIYNCYLEIIACRKVGTIKRVFQDEERHEHPIIFFKGSLRGFLVQLELTDPKADKDSVLFVGHKPLLF